VEDKGSVTPLTSLVQTPLCNFFTESDICGGHSETDGLPDYAWKCLDAAVYIPIIETHVRSLNIAVAAGIGLYEAIRQIDNTASQTAD
jgi:tRNA(Leu) C34 or U34 (ribose-2'-O)-methylase TrmL